MIFFDKNKVESLLPVEACIGAMRALFLLDPETALLNPLRTKMVLPSKAGLMGLMPAYIHPYKVMGVKVLSMFPDNYKLGLSSHMGVVLLFETETGLLLAGMDADAITAIRTAAVSALATDLLSRPDSENLCLLGTGVQAATHLEAMTKVRPVRRVAVWSRDAARVAAFAQSAQEKYGLPVKACASAAEAAAAADIICTLTASHSPVLQLSDVKKGAHINAVGASLPTARELDSALVQAAKVYVDNFESTWNEAGNVLIPMQEGRFGKDHVIGDLYRFSAGKAPGRSGEHDITVFNSVGLAVEDVAAGYYILKASSAALPQIA